MTPELYISLMLALSLIVAGQAIGFKIASAKGMLLERLRIGVLKNLDTTILNIEREMSKMVAKALEKKEDINASIPYYELGIECKKLTNKRLRLLKVLKPFGQCMPCTAGSTLTIINVVFVIFTFDLTVMQCIYLFFNTSLLSTFVALFFDRKIGKIDG